MKKKLLYPSLILLLIIIFLNACSEKTDVTTELGKEFTIGVGQSAKVSGEDLVMTFNEVTGDSRCPQNVTCIWAGEVSARVTIDYEGKENSITLVEPGLTGKAEYSFSGYTLAYHIEPYPIAEKEISLDKYRLTMTITK